MGLGLLILDLPRAWSRHTALDTAADALRERGIYNWSRLELRGTAATGTDLVRQFTFTYWDPSTHGRQVYNLSYTDLWERLDAADRTTLLSVLSGGTIGSHVTTTLARVAGDDFLVRDREGNQNLPRSLRHFLRAMDDHRR
ncbi:MULTISPECIES: hypothetical protein [Rhodococcus]|uniref:Uncharacterized protein n=2 Tax=Rhodococcus opacus TaxID=37919 RepID=C1BD57_RHOOB|nr:MULTISPECIES: hypothetical protein [Rhodococcus]EID81282.1 hypothetical protein W59_03346 [Rhodococcus opacus RKJ300 = JCM 13270]KAF0957083.1 hypothetical protein MLGJGCBP_08913 [Rhodococcus sp. T7]KAF0959829.1 hypothetical protein MLGJGCBP_07068 [Rhodococcus sp. T7]QQZ19278.1 hypothetical protein GO592_38285 [Rhodococcus sp. 21391]UOT08052.1 hypothetical protein MPY17_37365 [Rhodococcus opacus]